jgi:hypothetical protein
MIQPTLSEKNEAAAAVPRRLMAFRFSAAILCGKENKSVALLGENTQPTTAAGSKALSLHSFNI